ncbi:hypothetical protein RvY_07741-2 [Ramazzottius varieornatus]|uniref:RING-Gid-type domain-containing protein n=1 Tax=Ramazzottius varieornatus TaxID=947166 RepID=A0A1D1VBL9_RAMVA|nr:hypothetical protein RvY_07741-2 [Ramazzottius varieornatus]
MDACSGVDIELDKVQAKFTAIRQSSIPGIDEVLQVLEAMKSDLQRNAALVESEEMGTATLSSEQKLSLKLAATKAKDTASKVSQQHRDVHPAISRLGKVIDRVFTQDFNVINCPESLEGPDKTSKVVEAIMEHLYRQGLLEVAHRLAEEAHVQVKAEKSLPFLEMNSVLQSLADKNVQPALQWAEKHRKQLEERHSHLEYKLHKLQFLELLKQCPENTRALLEYSRKFQNFRSTEQIKDIQKLMGCLLFLNYGIDRSPYRDLVNQDLWMDVGETFTKDACALMGLSMESPLTVCLKIGCKAIPVLLNLKTMMVQQHVGEIWTSSKTELPIEIDVSPEHLYHSRFTCPILRQQSTEKNPPMRLNCGHVISKEALARLAISTKSSKVKCPYCPSEQIPSDAKRLFL